MEKKNNNRHLHIRIYRYKYQENIRHVVIVNKRSDTSRILSLPKNAVKTYIKKLLHRDVKKIKIVEVSGTQIEIDREIVNSGWLVFPRQKLAVGVIFFGNRGVVATSHIPSRFAYFVPIDTPILYLSGLVVKDFY